MTGAEYIVETLISFHSTDAFGIPGGVILDLLYAMEARKPLFTLHLSYHEQAAGFAANGYAQSSGKLGMAYATRGPGFTNLVTPIADAYYDSVPVLYITAHSATCPPNGMRVMADQEIDTCSIVRNITKKALRLDDTASFAQEFKNLCKVALTGRKGPVFLDVSTKILSQEIEINYNTSQKSDDKAIPDVSAIVDSIRNAKCPIILAGDGINQANARDFFQQFCKKAHIPVVSSRFTHDILEGSDQYYGYVGSHGIRCANFILSKTDLILSIGNRLHFPVLSSSFSCVYNHANIIRCEIDDNELSRDIPNSTSFICDARQFIQALMSYDDYGSHEDWIKNCNIIRDKLSGSDINDIVKDISFILKRISEGNIVVNDVGNNEFWVSRASVYGKNDIRTLYSKSLGTLGCGIPKSIGAYYATNKPIVCFVGDQGFQMNIQELQFIVSQQLPITIVVVNNSESGMIKDKELQMGKSPLHTTIETGYSVPSIKKISEAYDLQYYSFDDFGSKRPSIIEIKASPKTKLVPQLPKGQPCQDMLPLIDREMYNFLNSI